MFATETKQQFALLFFFSFMPCKWGGVAAPDFPTGSER